VTGVGRKYVRAGEGEDPDPRWATEFYDTGDGHAYLTENKDWGHRRMLFASKETVDAYLRKRELYDRLQTRVNLGAAQFTLEELEAVDAVLGGAAEQQAEEKEG
ncbi:MAG: hypothetical protein NC489_41920, partial [Ruminococcus flavefaciens]|nr:hypothetical protein [Ruminococcus flavefaciens]